MLLLFRVLDGYRPVRHTKVRRNRFLPTDSSGRLRLRTRHTVKDPNLQHALDLLDRRRQIVHQPHPLGPVLRLARRDVIRQEERGERSVDDEEALVCFQAGAEVGDVSDHGGGGTEEFELGEDAVGCERDDFDWDCGPVG